jgi:hypothetical protein
VLGWAELPACASCCAAPMASPLPLVASATAHN